MSLYVLGFATGPILWAPLSELKGRRLPLLIGMFGFSIFQVAVATGKDLQTVLLCRFFGGLFGACPLAVVAAVFSDMFDNRTRGLAITVFSMTVFSGPLLAPFIGGFITMVRKSSSVLLDQILILTVCRVTSDGDGRNISWQSWDF